MSLANRAFVFATSKIPFLCANMNESYNAELLVIDALSKRKVAHPKSQKILSVGSSGETALALCSHPCFMESPNTMKSVKAKLQNGSKSLTGL